MKCTTPHRDPVDRRIAIRDGCFCGATKIGTRVEKATDNARFA